MVSTSARSSSRIRARRFAASSRSAVQNEPCASFSGVPIIPESTYPRNSTRATPRISAARSVSCTRRSDIFSPGSSISWPKPAGSPRVATTSTTRCPSEAAFAITPAVAVASSSGWAWKVTRVCGTRESSRVAEGSLALDRPVESARQPTRRGPRYGPALNLTLELANFRFALVFWGVTDAWSSCDGGARESRNCRRGARGGGAGLGWGRHAQPAVPAGGSARGHQHPDQRGRRGREDQPARRRLRRRLQRRPGLLQHGQRLEGQGHLRAQAESHV